VCEAAAEARLPIYLYGSRRPVLERLVHRLKIRFPTLEVAGIDPSRARPRVFPPPVDDPEDREDAERIHGSGARIAFVGLGCPLQEMWTAAQRERIGVPALCVGAAFDFHAGDRSRPPQWAQDRGIEWLFRLAQDPRRLAGRYARYNTLFLLHLGRALLARRWRGA
jgi:exopolysaccharide biosynthesis WecB/TagA/CpsF family protein